MTATALLQPGQDVEPPKRGKVKPALVGGAVGGGRSYRLEEGVVAYGVLLLALGAIAGFVDETGSFEATGGLV